MQSIASLDAQVKKVIKHAGNGGGILALALLLRLIYYWLLSPRQICGLNDAANIQLAASTADSCWTAKTLGSLGASLNTQWVPQLGQTALELLIRSGPTYSFYLSLLCRMFGLPKVIDFNTFNGVGFVTCNIFFDAVACMLIYYAARLAFSRRTALIAGLLAAIYPAAIANTAHCYAESFGFFLVSAWICLLCCVMLRHISTAARAAASLGIGAL
ncbi:MAG: hypothetical protein ACRD3W_19310, partial [Terriglobales bacterium]